MGNTISKRPAPGNGPYIVAQALARSATYSSTVAFTVNNPGYHRGVVAYLNVHSLPGSASATINIAALAVCPLTGGVTAILSPGVARSATGLTMYQIHPSLTVNGDSYVSRCAPSQILFNISISAGATSKDIVFSLGIEWLP